MSTTQQDLSVALVQADQDWENKEANLQRYSRLLQDVHCDLILLPEMFHTGFTMQTALAEDWNDSPALAWLKQTAKEKNAAIYTSFIVRDAGQCYNRGVFVTSEGSVDIYDKRRTFSLAGEDRHYQRGTEEKIVEYKGWKFQLQICYDLRFPELCRNRLDSNLQPAYDVLVYVANWPERRIAHWNALLKARAIENQCNVLGVNRVGTDATGLQYNGASQYVNAMGETVLLPEHTETVQVVVMKMNELSKTREIIPFLKDR
jgi:predicted amidohydrolase